MLASSLKNAKNVTKFMRFFVQTKHTTYSRNNMGQKCEGNIGLWVLNEMIKKIYPENLKKIVGAIWELPAKQHSQSSPFTFKLD